MLEAFSPGKLKILSHLSVVPPSLAHFHSMKLLLSLKFSHKTPLNMPAVVAQLGPRKETDERKNRYKTVPTKAVSPLAYRRSTQQLAVKSNNSPTASKK